MLSEKRRAGPLATRALKWGGWVSAHPVTGGLDRGRENLLRETIHTPYISCLVLSQTFFLQALTSGNGAL